MKLVYIKIWVLAHLYFCVKGLVKLVYVKNWVPAHLYFCVKGVGETSSCRKLSSGTFVFLRKRIGETSFCRKLISGEFVFLRKGVGEIDWHWWDWWWVEERREKDQLHLSHINIADTKQKIDLNGNHKIILSFSKSGVLNTYQISVRKVLLRSRETPLNPSLNV